MIDGLQGYVLTDEQVRKLALVAHLTPEELERELKRAADVEVLDEDAHSKCGEYHTWFTGKHWQLHFYRSTIEYGPTADAARAAVADRVRENGK